MPATESRCHQESFTGNLESRNGSVHGSKPTVRALLKARTFVGCTQRYRAQFAAKRKWSIKEMDFTSVPTNTAVNNLTPYMEK